MLRSDVRALIRERSALIMEQCPLQPRLFHITQQLGFTSLSSALGTSSVEQQLGRHIHGISFVVNSLDTCAIETLQYKVAVATRTTLQETAASETDDILICSSAKSYCARD